MKLIVGLGNPGKDYAQTRHNLGWEVVLGLGEVLGVKFEDKSRFQSQVAEARISDEKILLALPQTYMNLSGEALQSLMHFYKVPLADVLVVHDEMDYPLGQLAFCLQAGPAGHNGIRSVQERLGTERISRLRLGIDRPKGRLPVEDYVLQKFSAEELPRVVEVIKKGIQAAQDWIEVGTYRAMNTWNRKSAS